MPFVQSVAHPSCTFLRKFAIVSEHSLIGLLQNNHLYARPATLNNGACHIGGVLAQLVHVQA